MQHLRVVKSSIQGHISCHQVLREYSQDNTTFSALCSVLSVPSVLRGCVLYEKFSDFGIWSLHFAHKQTMWPEVPQDLFQKSSYSQKSLKMHWVEKLLRKESQYSLSLYVPVMKSIICTAALKWTEELYGLILFSVLQLNSDLQPVCVTTASLNRIYINPTLSYRITH